MRLNHLISSSGYCSRRQADRLIKAGRVTVNGEQKSLLYMTQSEDVIRIDGKILNRQVKQDVYIMLHKPLGIISTASPDIADNIIDYIDYPERIFPIGRLDRQTTGLILLTNDGFIVNHLLKAESQVEKEYHVTVNRPVIAEFLEGLRGGVSIYNPRVKGHTTTHPASVEKRGTHEFTIIISQGLNRQIRRMCRRYQYTVTALKRVRFKDLHLGDLPEGEWRYLNETEIAHLKEKS